MVSSTAAATGTRPRRRLTAEARRAAILDTAVAFFSRRGPAGSTRELAAELGVSVGLIHRYFSKDSLLDAVYERVFASRVDPAWVALLSDERLNLKERLLRFYRAYLAAVDDPVWARISLLSALDGSMLGRKYLDEHVSGILATIALQLRAQGERSGRPSTREIERVWVLHSAIVYFVQRKHIHGFTGDNDMIVEEAVDVFWNGIAKD